MNTVTIGKYHFTVIDKAKAPRKYDRLFASSERYEGVNLIDVYGRYSTQKAIAWNEWNDFTAEQPQLTPMWICSHNTSFFTLAFDVIHEGKCCRAYITPSYNYLLVD